MVVNDRAYTIRVRFPENTRATLDQIRNTMITSSSTGKTASLGSLAEFQDEAGQTEIRRENLQRDIAVTGRFEGVSLGTGMQMVQQAVAELHIPPSIRVVYGGTYAEQQKSFRDLLEVLVLAMVLVFTVLLFEFRTFAAPTAIIASALLSTSGRVSGAAGHRHHLQHLVVHGFDHGDRHRGQERNSAARRRPAFPRRRECPRWTR